MQGKVHVAIGVATVACMCVKYTKGFDIMGVNVLPEIAIFTAAAGSYAPDVDSSRTHSGQKHKVTSKVVSKVGGGHRGITHTLLFPVLLGLLMYFTQSYLVQYQYVATLTLSLLFGFEVGWVMHIFADLFNGKGCPIFWPIMRGKVHILDLPSDGIGAWCFAVVFVGLMSIATFGGVFGWF